MDWALGSPNTESVACRRNRQRRLRERSVKEVRTERVESKTQVERQTASKVKEGPAVSTEADGPSQMGIWNWPLVEVTSDLDKEGVGQRPGGKGAGL